MSRNAIQDQARQVLLCSGKKCEKRVWLLVNRAISRSNPDMERVLRAEVGLEARRRMLSLCGPS